MDFTRSLAGKDRVLPPMMKALCSPRNTPKDPLSQESESPRKTMCDRLTELLTSSIPEIDLDDIFLTENR